MVFTFWEGKMPEYIKMCMETWDFEYDLLDFESVKKYIEIPESIVRFSLPQISDYIRIHMLRDYGGRYFDTDTIFLGDAPEENITGYPHNRSHTISVLNFKAHDPMLEAWCEYQDGVVANPNSSKIWSIMGNDFSDLWVKTHDEITIYPLDDCWAELYMIQENIPRPNKYVEFYFKREYHLSDLKPTNMLMLHNSWTPDWYKRFSRQEILEYPCTLSKILQERLQ